MKASKDLITVDGAPASWALNRALAGLLAAARAEKLLPPGRPLALSVSVVDGPAMARLNGRFRGKRQPTDVLSFENPAGGPHLGDLVLCAPVVRSQAKVQGHGVTTEVRVLLVHGLLHLLGHDHERGGAKARRMAALEAKLLRRLGVNQGLIGRSIVD